MNCSTIDLCINKQSQEIMSKLKASQKQQQQQQQQIDGHQEKVCKQPDQTQTQIQTQTINHEQAEDGSKNCSNHENVDKQIKQAQASVESLKINKDQDLSDNELEKFKNDSPQKANLCKTKGNDLFRERNYSDAILEYQQGLQFTNDTSVRATLHSNIAVCFIKQEDFGMAKKYCKKALKQDPNHRKSRTNLARCYQQDNKIEQAFEEYKKVEQHLEGASPQDVKYVKDKIAYLQPKIDEINEKRKKEVLDGLKGIGNSILGYFGMSLDNFKLEQGPTGGYNISFKQ